MNEETGLDLLPGKTTKDDVFLTLGQPDEMSADGMYMIYRAVKVKAVYAIGYGGGEVNRIDRLTITFDEKNTVLRADFNSTWNYFGPERVRMR